MRYARLVSCCHLWCKFLTKNWYCIIILYYLLLVLHIWNQWQFTNHHGIMGFLGNPSPTIFLFTHWLFSIYFKDLFCHHLLLSPLWVCYHCALWGTLSFHDAYLVLHIWYSWSWSPTSYILHDKSDYLFLCRLKGCPVTRYFTSGNFIFLSNVKDE